MRRTQAANISLLRRRTAKVRAYCRSFGTLWVGKQGMSSLSREQHRDAARTHGLSRAFRGPSSERSLVAEPRPQQRRCMAGSRRGRGRKAGRCWELPIADEVSNPKGARVSVLTVIMGQWRPRRSGTMSVGNYDSCGGSRSDPSLSSPASVLRSCKKKRRPLPASSWGLRNTVATLME